MKLLIQAGVLGDVDAIRESMHDLGAAGRFGPAVDATFELLLTHPLIGRIRSFSTAGLRSFGVLGFNRYLVIYRTRGEDVEIFAVVDGVRALPSVLKSRE